LICLAKSESTDSRERTCPCPKLREGERTCVQFRDLSDGSVSEIMTMCEMACNLPNNGGRGCFYNLISFYFEYLNNNNFCLQFLNSLSARNRSFKNKIGISMGFNFVEIKFNCIEETLNYSLSSLNRFADFFSFLIRLFLRFHVLNREKIFFLRETSCLRSKKLLFLKISRYTLKRLIR
jgi:hypothetical protein